MHLLPLLRATCLLLAMAGAAHAGERPYLTAKQLDLLMLLPPPVAAGSAGDKAQIAAVIAAQASATPERIKLADADADESVFDMFTRTLGPNFTEQKLPVMSVFFARVGESEDETVDPAKKRFGRVRPFLATSDIKALIRSSKSGAYPSGHTTRVTMCAILLAQMLPQERDRIWARAEEYAQSRVVGGMHYPEDLAAGRMAGTAMAAVMLTDPAFRADFAAAQAELRQVMHANP